MPHVTLLHAETLVICIQGVSAPKYEREQHGRMVVCLPASDFVHVEPFPRRALSEYISCSTIYTVGKVRPRKLEVGRQVRRPIPSGHRLEEHRSIGMHFASHFVSTQ